jgi:hypothetical protein
VVEKCSRDDEAEAPVDTCNCGTGYCRAGRQRQMRRKCAVCTSRWGTRKVRTAHLARTRDSFWSRLMNCVKFENEYGKFLTATKSSPSDVERDEDDDDIPTRFFTKFTVAGGSRQVKIDTGAFAIWVSAAVYREIGTEPLAREGDANAADGWALPVLGSGRILLGLWGRTFDLPVRVMRTLPIGILIGRRFLIKHRVDLDFTSLRGNFPKSSGGDVQCYQGDCSSIQDRKAKRWR